MAEQVLIRVLRYRRVMWPISLSSSSPWRPIGVLQQASSFMCIITRLQSLIAGDTSPRAKWWVCQVGAGSRSRSCYCNNISLQ